MDLGRSKQSYLSKVPQQEPGTWQCPPNFLCLSLGNMSSLSRQSFYSKVQTLFTLNRSLQDRAVGGVVHFGIDGRGGRLYGYDSISCVCCQKSFLCRYSGQKPEEMGICQDREKALFCLSFVCKLEIPGHTSVGRDCFFVLFVFSHLCSFILGELLCRKHSKLPCTSGP